MSINSAHLCALIMLNTIGIGVLTETLKSAAYYLSHSNGTSMKKLKESAQSFTFVRGTGLEIIVSYYHLNYDIDKLKNSFFSLAGHREYIE